MNCEDINDIADSYLSNELLVETNHEVLRHIEECPDCRSEIAGRRELRQRLQTAVRNAPKSRLAPGFAAKVKTDLRDQAFGKQSVWRYAGQTAVAAGIFAILSIAVVIGIRLGDEGTPAAAKAEQSPPAVRSDPKDIPWYERASFVTLKNDAIEDHKHCALSHDLSEKPISLKEAKSRFGTAVDGLDAAVFEPLHAAFGDDARFLTAHFCLVNGRRFSHVVVVYKKKIVSVLITLHDDGDVLAGPEAVSCDRSADLRVACFESGKYSVFIVSDLAEDENLMVAKTLSASVNSHVAKMAA